MCPQNQVGFTMEVTFDLSVEKWKKLVEFQQVWFHQTKKVRIRFRLLLRRQHQKWHCKTESLFLTVQPCHRTAHVIEQLKKEEEIEREEKGRETKERDQDKNHDDFYKLILEVVYDHFGIFCGNADQFWYDALGCRNQVVRLTGNNLEVMFYTGSDGNHLQWPR